jgi:uncharacterized membrane protein
MVKYKWKLNHTYIKFKHGYKWQTFIYFVVLFLRTSKCSIIVSCHPSFGWWSFRTHHPLDKIPFPGAWICWFEPNEGVECFIQLLEEMMLHGCTIRIAVHFVVISTIVSCKRARVQFMGVDEPFNTLTLSKQLSSSMAISPPQCQQCQPHQLDLSCNPHC